MRIKVIIASFVFIIALCSCGKKGDVIEETEVVESTEVAPTLSETDPVSETTEAETEPPENGTNYRTYHSVEDSSISVRLFNPIKNSVDYTLYYKDEAVDSGYISLIFADRGEMYGYSNNSFFIRPIVTYTEDTLSLDYSQCKESDYGSAVELYKFIQEKMPALMSFKCEDKNAFEDITDLVEDNGKLIEASREVVASNSFTLKHTPQPILDNSIVLNKDAYKLYLSYSSSQAINYSLFYSDVEIDNGSISLLWADDGLLYLIPSYALMSKEHAVRIGYHGGEFTIDYNTMPDKSYIDRNHFLRDYLSNRVISFWTDYNVVESLTGLKYVEGHGYLSPEVAEQIYRETEPVQVAEQPSDSWSGVQNTEYLSQDYNKMSLHIDSEVLSGISPVRVSENWNDGTGYESKVYQNASGPGSSLIVIYIERDRNMYSQSVNISSEGAFSKIIGTAMSKAVINKYNALELTDGGIISQLDATFPEIVSRNNRYYAQKNIRIPLLNSAHIATLEQGGISYGVIVVSKEDECTPDETLNYANLIIDNLSFSVSE